MNLNLLTLFAPPAQNQAPALGGPNLPSSIGAPSSGANLGDVMFGQLLAAQLRNPQLKAALQNVTENVAQAGKIGDQLKAAVAQLLQNGTKLEAVVDQLAQTLGSDVLSQLQKQLGITPGADAQTTINRLIAQALGPPANGPPLPAAQVAAALVERLTEVADALAKVSDNAAGQQHESLGTTVSDAKAGDNPAPTTGTPTILQIVLAALQPYLATPLAQSTGSSTNSGTGPPAGNSSSGSSPQNLAPAPVPPPAPWVPTTVSSAPHATPAETAASGNAATATAQVTAQSSGGPTVAANPVLTLVGTGGDTVIGRILARAANVAANQAPAQPDAPQPGTATLQPQVAIAPAASATGGTAGDALLASLLRSLQTAFPPLGEAKSDSATADSGSSLGPVATTTPSTSSVFASLGLGPIVSTTFDSSAPAPAQNQPASTPSYVDPNGIVDQVLAGISMRYQPDGTQTVRMRLVPESLGDVTVNLQVQNGSVTATLLAQTTDVRDALLANQQLLVRSLADAGLKLSSFTVNLANGGLHYQQSQYSKTPQFGTTRRLLGTNSDSADDTVAAVPTFGPPQTQLAALQWLNALA